MKAILKSIYESFTNAPGGFSARKLSAFYCLVIGTVATFKFGSNANSTELTVIWVLAAFLFLGIITFQQITDFRNGNTTITKSKTVIENKTETTE
jgi:hypothetical protein